MIRKFIEEMGEKVLPRRRRQGLPEVSRSPFGNRFADADNECAVAIRKYLLAQTHFAAPSDLVVLFNELDDVVILAGTVRDARARDLIVEAAGNIQGVEKVDDRMTAALRRGWR